MSLQSQLFRGDPKLEAAAVSDPAHIVPGAKGDHVRKIQMALIQLDGAVIVPDGIYGPSTADAVLAYKKKRNIVNRSYQTQPDNISGKMTVAALDRELFDKESPAAENGVAICKFTDVRCHQRGATLSFAASASPAPISPPSPLKHAIEVMGMAKTWAGMALMWLRALRGFYLQGGRPPESLALFETVNVHFHLTGLPRAEEQANQLDKIITNYANILSILNNPNVMGDDPNLYSDPQDPRFGAFASAKIGGFHDSSVSKKVWFHGLFLSVPGQKARVAIILHECAHSVASGLHYAYGHPKASGGAAGEPLGRGARHPRNYEKLTPDEALHNADTYSTFAAHASTSNPGPAGDIRPGAHNINE